MSNRQVDSCVVGMSQRRSGKHQGGSGLAELSNGKFAIERPWRRRAASTPNMLYHCSRDESQKRCAQSGAILNIRRSKWSFMHTACVLRAVSRTDESDGTRQRRKIATNRNKMMKTRQRSKTVINQSCTTNKEMADFVQEVRVRSVPTMENTCRCVGAVRNGRLGASKNPRMAVPDHDGTNSSCHASKNRRTLDEGRGELNIMAKRLNTFWQGAWHELMTDARLTSCQTIWSLSKSEPLRPPLAAGLFFPSTKKIGGDSML